MELRNKPILYFYVGLPGSGKSSWAESHKEELNFIVHSSDEIRTELGNVNDQSKNELVFNTLHRRVKDDLLNGNNVCMDATNLSRKRRMNFINQELRDIPCEKVCVLFATPYDICLRNNANRERKVPEEVIEKMYKNFEVPWYSDGFDDIQIVWWDWKKDGLEFNIFRDIMEWCRISHDNPHHRLSVGDHMLAAYNYYMDNFDCTERNKLLEDAILLHDCGKPYVKSYIDKDGNVGTRARYFEHHNVGSYNSLFYMEENRVYSNEEVLYISLLIGLHMRPFLAWKESERAKEKDRRLFGDDIMRSIDIIHQCDRAAH